MATLFVDLMNFFGLSAAAPENLGELFPWLFSVVLAVGVFLYVFEIVKDFVHTFARGRFL